jgi:hypothetical protein
VFECLSRFLICQSFSSLLLVPRVTGHSRETHGWRRVASFRPTRASGVVEPQQQRSDETPRFSVTGRPAPARRPGMWRSVSRRHRSLWCVAIAVRGVGRDREKLMVSGDFSRREGRPIGHNRCWRAARRSSAADGGGERVRKCVRGVRVPERRARRVRRRVPCR